MIYWERRFLQLPRWVLQQRIIKIYVFLISWVRVRCSWDHHCFLRKWNPLNFLKLLLDGFLLNLSLTLITYRPAVGRESLHYLNIFSWRVLFDVDVRRKFSDSLHLILLDLLDMLGLFYTYTAFLKSSFDLLLKFIHALIIVFNIKIQFNLFL